MAASPIIAKPADRDPLRNFKFRVDFIGNTGVSDPFRLQAGFISVSGLGIQTDMIPYREGGDNTITRKMPGQSDVGPLQLVRGLFMLPNSPQYEWFLRVFAVNWGNGNTKFNDDFRCNAIRGRSKQQSVCRTRLEGLQLLARCIAVQRP
jgi:phage tail-like protein